MKNLGEDILFGVAVGDALGVPYEFYSRDRLEKFPAKDMIGSMSHNQAAGTWSDDSSMTFCLAETLIEGYSLELLAKKFIDWKDNAYWTARGEVFDIGITTSISISRLDDFLTRGLIDELPNLILDSEENENGNGSLMRILPLIFEIRDKDIKEQFDIVFFNSALTHRHIRAAMSCMIYLKFAELMMKGQSKEDAYENTRIIIKKLWSAIDYNKTELKHFDRLILNDIRDCDRVDILSGGYVIESLESSFWSFLKSDSYENAVLTAINLGEDTDTNGAITGGLAGIYYGFESIPDYWIASIARMEDIKLLGEQLNNKYIA